MREIKAKAHVRNKKELLDKLTALGYSFSNPIVQKDRIFLPAGTTIPVPSGVNVLRVRDQNGKYVLTFKRPMKNQLDCIERELEIDNPDEMAEICKLLGFYESISVSKIRQKAKYRDFEICLDTVEGIGDFIEVEKMTDENASSEVIQDELFSFLQSLGIKKEDQVFGGYDILLMRLTDDVIHK